MDKYYFDTVIIGAGVVGLAVARAAAAASSSVAVLEAEKVFGCGTSSRNSEVIHAGIYYPKETKKAELCIRGKSLLYQYCLSKSIPHKKLGKFVVATTDKQAATLENILDNALENGMTDLFECQQKNFSQLQHLSKLTLALHSPSTGILDTHSLMQALETDLINQGGIISYNSKVTDIAAFRCRNFEIVVNDNYIVCCKNLVNAAGLEAVNLRQAMPVDWKVQYTNAYFKGNYFGYSSAVPFSSLIYPVPEEVGLGVHLTLDIAGRARFGPNTEPVESLNYSVDTALKKRFVDEIRNYWPAVCASKLFPDYAGIRPKVKNGNSISNDFIIETEYAHGLQGLVNLLNIESPGVTSCLAIAEDVLSWIKD